MLLIDLIALLLVYRFTYQTVSMLAIYMFTSLHVYISECFNATSMLFEAYRFKLSENPIDIKSYRGHCILYRTKPCISKEMHGFVNVDSVIELAILHLIGTNRNFIVLVG